MFKIDHSVWSDQWFQIEEIPSHLLEAYKNSMGDNVNAWMEKYQKYPLEDVYLLICCRDNVPVSFLTALIDDKSESVIIYEIHVVEDNIKPIGNKHTFLSSKTRWMENRVNDAFNHYKIIYT